MFPDRCREQIRTENGADGNIIDTTTLRQIIAAGADSDVEKLNVPCVFDIDAASTD